MKKNKLILFDWGGVVEYQEEGFVKAYKKMYKYLGYDNDDLIQRLGKYHLSSIKTIDEYELIFEDMKREFNLGVDFNTYLKIYDDFFENIEYNIDVAKYEVSLKDKCYIGILSNLSIRDHGRINKELGLDNYDYVFLSYELGLQKPNKEIYEKVQSMLPFEPKDILFIDDLEKNIIPARELGWNTCQASNKELDKIKQACKEFINEENE